MRKYKDPRINRSHLCTRCDVVCRGLACWYCWSREHLRSYWWGAGSQADPEYRTEAAA